MGSRMMVSKSGLLPETSYTPWIRRAGRRCARLMSPRMQERPSTASTVSDRRGSHPEDRSKDGRVLATIPAPVGGGHSGLAWTEGTLWVGQYEDRKIYQVDPQTGAILRTIEISRFVTRVTWIDGELWHGTWEGDESDLRRVDPRTGEVLESLEMPPGVGVSGLEAEGGDQFFCGGGSSGKVRTVRRPRPGSASGSGSEIPGDSTSQESKRPSRARFAEPLREEPGRQGALPPNGRDAAAG